MQTFNASDLIAAMAALNPTWMGLLQGDGMAGSDIAGRILEQYPNTILKMAGVRPYSTDKYSSAALEDAFTQLIFAGILTKNVPGSIYRWTCPQTPEEYFNEAIKPNLTGEHLNELEQLASSLTALRQAA